MTGGVLVVDNLKGGQDSEHRQVEMNSDGGCCGWVYHSSDGIETLEADIALLQTMLRFLKTGDLDA
jgi:hypothetical protein